LAVEDGPGVIRLVNPETGKEYARLEAPTQTRFGGLCFTPDGSQLVAVGDQSQAIHIWDLRAIRRQLAQLGLDWDLRPYPPARAKAVEAGPLRVTVVQKPLK
jgi:hypothetical protein